MSNEDRQRVIRRAGFKPAQAETEERAQKSREAKREEDAELAREAGDGDSAGKSTPLAEDPAGPPRPRR
jgi:hypothetical protein